MREFLELWSCELESCEEPRERGGDSFLVIDIARRETFGLDQSFDHFDFVSEESKLSQARAPTCAMLRDSDRGWYGRGPRFHDSSYKPSHRRALKRVTDEY